MKKSNEYRTLGGILLSSSFCSILLEDTISREMQINIYSPQVGNQWQTRIEINIELGTPMSFTGAAYRNMGEWSLTGAKMCQRQLHHLMPTSACVTTHEGRNSREHWASYRLLYRLVDIFPDSSQGLSILQEDKLVFASSGQFICLLPLSVSLDYLTIILNIHKCLYIDACRERGLIDPVSFRNFLKPLGCLLTSLKSFSPRRNASPPHLPIVSLPS